MSAGLLLLADGRLPAGGHAHSGGVEAAAADGSLRSMADLGAFLRGRLATAGLVSAAVAAAACASGGGEARVLELDAETDARTASPALRATSRAQGRALLRAGRTAWPALTCPLVTPHHPVALGLVAAAAGLTPLDAALAAAHGAVSGPAWAAVRLLAFDPLELTHLLAGLTAQVDDVAGQAVASCRGPARDLAAATAVRLDLLAQTHAAADVRLFAS